MLCDQSSISEKYIKIVLLLATALYYDYVYNTMCEPRGDEVSPLKVVASNAKHL